MSDEPEDSLVKRYVENEKKKYLLQTK
jgi:factor associated with neutral sphingomyelinase activation